MTDDASVFAPRSQKPQFNKTNSPPLQASGQVGNSTYDSQMQRPLLRIPYTGPLPAPRIIPRFANTPTGAVSAFSEFLTAPPSTNLQETADPQSTVILTGAGISVASGLADYRGENGTYRVNKTYRPIYYHEFLQSHEARKRYWARSFLGWTHLQKARPNSTHHAIKQLGEMGIIRSVITQNVDSFHPIAHPQLPTLELHGYLRSVVCTTCHNELPREDFQKALSRLNPIWAAFLAEVTASGALGTEHPKERLERGIKTNPDGDIDLPNAPYSTFRYPACPHCLTVAPTSNGSQSVVEIDSDGSWKPPSTAGVLKPAVVMFGESITSSVKEGAEQAIDTSGRLLVVGTSLATYSAWRLAKRAKERGMPVGILNLGGVRGEEFFFENLMPTQNGEMGVRAEIASDKLLPELVSHLQRLHTYKISKDQRQIVAEEGNTNSQVLKDLMS